MTAPSVAPDLKTICAWCDVVIRDGVEPISHGICPACAREFRERHFPKKESA